MRRGCRAPCWFPHPDEASRLPARCPRTAHVNGNTTESHAAAEMTLARLTRHLSTRAQQSAAEPPPMLLYGQFLSASCEEILGRRRREKEFLDCSLTVALYERHHGSLASIIEAKLHLDRDLAMLVFRLAQRSKKSKRSPYTHVTTHAGSDQWPATQGVLDRRQRDRDWPDFANGCSRYWRSGVRP